MREVAARASPASRQIACYHFCDMLSRDTSPDAEAMQLRFERNRTGQERLLEALEMSVFARELAKAKIRRDHPDWTDAQVAREVLRLEFLPDSLPPGLR